MIKVLSTSEVAAINRYITRIQAEKQIVIMDLKWLPLSIALQNQLRDCETILYVLHDALLSHLTEEPKEDTDAGNS